MNTYFLSDPHFGHKLAFEQRPFATIEEMDQTIIDNVVNTIERNDIVFWLGDMFFSKSARRLEIAAQLTAKGRHILILGNHDRGRITYGQFRRMGFYPVKMYQFNNLILTHEPLSESNLNYVMDMGVRANIHGHLHLRDIGLNPSKYLCVSVDQLGFKPISYKEVKLRLSSNG